MPNRETRDRYLKRTWGVSLEEWEAILEAQGGGCAGCGAKGGSRALHTDHNHGRGGIVRGILCLSCNSALQKLRDNADTAYRLSEYLRTPPASIVLGRDVVPPNPPKRRRKRARTKRT